MGFLTSLFGAGDNMIVTVLIALAVVLLLIVLGVWSLKLVMNASGNVARGRTKRLAVVEVAPVDQRRQLLLLRRDNKEYLVLIGGNQDLMLDSGIEVAEPVAPRRPAPSSRTRRPGALAKSEAAIIDGLDEATPKAQSGLERLKDLGRPLTQRRSPSLRHTGLLRPVSRMESEFIPSDDNSTLGAADSDMNEPEQDRRNGGSIDEVHPDVDDNVAASGEHFISGNKR